MAVESNIKSDAIQAMEADPGNRLAVTRRGGRVRYAEGIVTTTGTTTTSGSTYRAVRLPSNARVVQGSVQGIGGIDLPNVSAGAAHATDSGISDGDAFATLLDIDDTGDHFFAGHVSESGDRRLWQVAGASANPGGEIDVLLTLAADAVAAGQFMVRVWYVVD